MYKDKEVLRVFRSMLIDLEETSSHTAKAEILTEYITRRRGLAVLLDHACNPFRQYYTTSVVAESKGHFDESLSIVSLPEVLDQLEGGTYRGQKAYDLWVTYVRNLPEDLQMAAQRVLDKDLKCRIQATTINKVLEQLEMSPIPVFGVALGFPWNANPVWNDRSEWYWSRKLDGVRCCAVLREGHPPVLYSRQGKQFFTLGKIEEALQDVSDQNCILDGELALRTDGGKDDFQGLMKHIRRKDWEIPNPVFHVFDCIPLDGSTPLFQERYRKARWICKSTYSKKIVWVRQHLLKNEAQFQEAQETAALRGWEGLILRANKEHKTGRSRDILKVKEMREMELLCTGIETGPIRIVGEDGREKTIQVMTAAIVAYKDGTVGVGSGWTIKQRRYYRRNPHKLIGMLLTVQYFEETRNQQGGFGLRFPVVKWNHGSERTT